MVASKSKSPLEKREDVVAIPTERTFFESPNPLEEYFGNTRPDNDARLAFASSLGLDVHAYRHSVPSAFGSPLEMDVGFRPYILPFSGTFQSMYPSIARGYIHPTSFRLYEIRRIVQPYVNLAHGFIEEWVDRMYRLEEQLEQRRSVRRTLLAAMERQPVEPIPIEIPYMRDEAFYAAMLGFASAKKKGVKYHRSRKTPLAYVPFFPLFFFDHYRRRRSVQ